LTAAPSRPPKETEQSLQSLAAYLSEGAKTDRQKVRAIYRWVTDRIAYDTETYFAGRRPDDSAEVVLKTRRGMCGGYASLFAALCQRVGVRVVKLNGWTRSSVSHTSGLGDKNRHFWNAVHFEGKWWLIDATWGAGGVSNRKFVKRSTNRYYLTPPEQLIFTHLPEDPQWQFLAEPLSKEQFLAQPQVPGLLFEMGMSAASIRKATAQQNFRGFFKVFSVPGVSIRVLEAPLGRHLKAGKVYRFRLECTGFTEVRMYAKGLQQELIPQGRIFEGEIVATRGRMIVGGVLPGQPNRYYSVLEYSGE
jgi:hypothetical protein